MPGFKILTEREMREEFADMLVIYAEKGAQGLESHILAKGRNEMHQLLAYLFVRATMAEIDKTKLQEKHDQLIKRLAGGG
jgi:hypothetical protein